MDKLIQGSRLGGSLSGHIPVRSAFSINLPFASSSLTTSTSGAPAPANKKASSELDELFARMRKHLEKGKWEPEDSAALLSLLDEGWYSKAASKPNTPRDTTHRPSTAPTTARVGAGSGRGIPTTANTNNINSHSGQIPAIRPLDLASLRDHTTNSVLDPCIDSGVMFSARSNATARWAAAAFGDGAHHDFDFDTPRSWVTAASMAASLPQSKHEMDAMDIEQVQKLAEDADVLQQRAAVALKLAQARLKKTHQHRRHSQNMSAVFFLALNMMLMMMTAVLDALFIVVEVVMRLVADQRVYSVVGAVAGAVQGVVCSVLRGTPNKVQ